MTIVMMMIPVVVVDVQGYTSRGKEKCEACSRLSGGMSYTVYLFGPSYTSSKLWDSRKWVEYLPPSILLYNKPPSDVQSPGISSSVAMVCLSDGSEDDSSEDDNDDDDNMRTARSTLNASRRGGNRGESPALKGDADGKVPWWKRRWPQELLKEPDSKWTVTK